MKKKILKNKKESIVESAKAEQFISDAIVKSKNFESCDCHIITSMRFSHVENPKKSYDFSFLFPQATKSTHRIKVFSKDPEINSYIAEQYLLTAADIANIKNKKIHFDILLTTTRDMSDLGAIYKILGPKKMVPTDLRGTLAKDTSSLKKLFLEWNSGQRRKVSLNLRDNCSDISFSLGKLSSQQSHITDNMYSFINFMDTMINERQSFVLKTKYAFRVLKIALSSTQGKQSCRIK